MKISVTFRNTEGESWQKEYVEEKLAKIKKYFDHPVDAKVVLLVEKFRNVAEINLMANGWSMNAKEEAKDMHLAIDECIEKIERQLKKHKEKIRGHKTNMTRSEGIGAVSNVAEEIDDTLEPKIIEVRKVVLPPMSMDDAILQMENSRNHFVVFRDTTTERVHVIYRRDDGRYGLIETNG
ncbi:MAG: ribosome-associated translation inhibitor RaiA [Syntrophales bacterium]